MDSPWVFRCQLPFLSNDTPEVKASHQLKVALYLLLFCNHFTRTDSLIRCYGKESFAEKLNRAAISYILKGFEKE